MSWNGVGGPLRPARSSAATISSSLGISKATEGSVRGRVSDDVQYAVDVRPLRQPIQLLRHLGHPICRHARGLVDHEEIRFFGQSRRRVRFTGFDGEGPVQDLLGAPFHVRLHPHVHIALFRELLGPAAQHPQCQCGSPGALRCRQLHAALELQQLGLSRCRFGEQNVPQVRPLEGFGVQGRRRGDRDLHQRVHAVGQSGKQRADHCGGGLLRIETAVATPQGRYCDAGPRRSAWRRRAIAMAACPALSASKLVPLAAVARNASFGRSPSICATSISTGLSGVTAAAWAMFCSTCAFWAAGRDPRKSLANPAGLLAGADRNREGVEVPEPVVAGVAEVDRRAAHGAQQGALVRARRCCHHSTPLGQPHGLEQRAGKHLPRLGAQ